MSISRLVTPLTTLGVFSILASLGCSSSSNNTASATGGSAATTAGGSSSTAGGSTSTAVNNSGGNGATGGRTVAGSGVGGTVPSLGGASSGGSANTGGTTTSTGGTKVTTGGTTSTGGATPTGGVTANGGTAATGGTQATGGASATGGVSPSTGGAATGGSATAGCPGTGGPTMVALPLGYYIDSTEVTQGQYQTWLDTSPSTSNQTAVCAWNTTYTPSSGWPPTSSTLNYPVVYVDWCDAYAYCAGVGKRLCGKIGGGSNGYSDYADATLSQWYAACTSNGTYSSTGFPYGNTYQPGYCNATTNYTLSGPGSAAVAVGTLPNCQSTISGYTGVYDLSGNVGEWEDSCDSGSATGQWDYCRVRGGAFGFGATSSSVFACGYGTNGISQRANAQANLGVRCCAP